MKSVPPRGGLPRYIGRREYDRNPPRPRGGPDFIGRGIVTAKRNHPIRVVTDLIVRRGDQICERESERNSSNIGSIFQSEEATACFARRVPTTRRLVFFSSPV